MEEETFEDVMADGPTDYSKHVAFVLFDFDKFDAWLDRLKDAHEREVREHTLEYDIDGLSDSELAEHWLVRKDKEHIISHATVEVTPHIDWSRMADELDEFVEIVRGIAGGAE